MGKRLRIQSVLEESLRHRELLMRELHHRVRNNLQMISGMLALSRADTAPADAKMALREAESRVAAIAAVQQAFHSLEQSDAIPASEFIEQLCATLRAGPLAGHNVTSSLEPIRLPNDLVAPVALILNELLINAAKHGYNDADEPIAIEFKRVDGEISLSVRDRGPGFDLAQTRKRLPVWVWCWDWRGTSVQSLR